MAKKPTAAKPTINKALLIAIGAGTITHVSQADGMPLKDAGYIDVNTTDLDANGNAATRLTDAGKAYIAPADGAEAAKPSFEIVDGFVPPVSKRGSKAGAPSLYPFADVELNKSFFVPASEKHPDPVKSLQSGVAAANMKWSKETGEVESVIRTKRGEGNKAVLDAAGNKVKETVDRPKREAIRKFKISRVEAGKVYGQWTATINGAMITRVL